MKRIHEDKEATLAIQCYDQIQDAIIDGTFAPGQKLKVEALKAQFAVGQSPIREALSRLAVSGLVQVEENKGFRVTQISQADMRDIYETLFQIEMLALKQAMERGDDAWEASIVAALHQLSLVEHSQEPVEYHVWAERNYAFHVALIAGCNSPLLLQLRADVYRRFDRYCRIAFKAAQEKLMVNNEEHKKLADAVLKRDVQAVQELMHHHIFGAFQDVVQLLKQHSLL